MEHTSAEKRKAQVVILCQDHILLLKCQGRRQDVWQNVTGSVESHEDFLIGAIRELKEETGIESVSLIDLGLIHRFIDQYQKFVVEKCFLYYSPKKPQIILSEEHSEFQWIPVSKIKETDYTFPSNYQAYKKAKEILERQATP